ncbi:putative membrane protein C19orf24 [Merluccius polli]|uniref:Membrane protein C19orf24 n=1 Tax=Merluccius polli TaxID=89951 RepID=A0AA47MT62_MERPO|nr:putative membrane protein C19orf24 [Merluccius polli]
MRTERLVSAVLVLVCAAAQKGRPAATRQPPVSPSVSNSTNSRVLLRGLAVDGMMIQRALYVLIGFTMLGVLYLLVRAVRMKRPLQKKYGLLENCDDGVELDPLESEEDNTMYEARTLRRSE